MIYAENGNFLLETAHTTYAFCVDPAGNLQHLYYGEKLSLGDSWQKALEAVVLSPNFGGTGFETGTVLFQDFDARIYLMEGEK